MRTPSPRRPPAANWLQVLFFAVLLGLALAKFGEHGPPVVFELIEHLSSLLFTIVGWIMKLAPLAAFGAMAYIIGQYGISSLGSYAKLTGACYLAAALFIPVLGAIAWFLAGVKLWRFVVYINDELFLAQALGVDLSLGEQITAVLVLMLTSKGIAAIGHGAIQVAAVALLLGADRILDSMRVSVNLLGNCVETMVVARWEGQLDSARTVALARHPSSVGLVHANPRKSVREAHARGQHLGASGRRASSRTSSDVSGLFG